MINIRKLFFILSISFLSSTMFSQDIVEKPEVKERSSSKINFRSSSNTSQYDIKYHRLELAIDDPSVAFIKGNVTTYFVPLQNISSIYFDFRNNMIVDSAKYHGIGINHIFSTSTELRLDFGTTISTGILDSVTVFYHGSPQAGGFGAFQTKNTTCSSQDSVLWTLSEPYGAKNWWPCKEVLTDKIDSIDMYVTAPVSYHIGSNGLLVSRDTIASGNKVTDHWKHRYPIPAYLVAFAASEYSIYKDTFDLYNGGQLEVLNYVFPCDSATAHQNTKNLDTVMNFFIKKFGAYPFENEKYGHAQCRFGGGMEHTTMTFMGGWWYYILIHELAHQWFGDKVTCGSWHHIWLNEGFATYLEGLTREEGIQSGSFHDWLNSKKNSVTSIDTGSVYCPDTTDVNRIFSSRLTYNKGAYLLHMLRWILGDDDFFTGLNDYINDPALAYNFVLTKDLQTHLETAGDTVLDEFFDDWFYREGWPNYHVKWSVDAACGNKLRVEITQTHSANHGTFFEMPVPIKFSDGINDTLIVYNQKTVNDTLFFSFPDFEPTSAQFDPDLWLCAKHTISKESVPIKTIHWTGETNNLWNTSTNWDCGIPTLNDDVIIPKNTPQCILLHNGFCKHLKIEKGGKLTTPTDAILHIGN